MELDIANFLPKYPNITKKDVSIFDPYDENFYEAIYKKKEFYDIKLQASEPVPEKRGELMNHQKIIARFLSSYTPYDQLLLMHDMGCLAPDTPVLLWNGSVKRADHVQVGDYLIGDDGKKREVVSLINGTSEMYEIRQYKADTYVVNQDHILSLKISGNFAITWTEKTQTWTLRWFDKKLLKSCAKTKSCKNISKEVGYKYIKEFRDQIFDEDDTLDIRVKDYTGLSKTTKSYLKGFKSHGVSWDTQDIKLDPYVLGLWLGDGNSRGDGFTSTDQEIVDCLTDWAAKNHSQIKRFRNEQYGYYIRGNDPKISTFKDLLRVYNLLENKHIPIEYIINSRENRLKLLAGLIDTDGYVYNDGTCIEILQKNIILANQICYIARSLGISCQQKTRKKSCMYKGEKRTGNYEWISISGFGLEEIPTRILKKKLQPRNQVKDPLCTHIEIISKGVGAYYGWELDNETNCRFLLGDFTVTHNTGKTCSSIGAIEQIKEEGLGFKRAMIFANGQGLLNNYLNELVFKCTDGRYIPEDYDKLTELEKTIRKKKMVSEYYSFNTFETFAKEIRRKPLEKLKERYDNTIIVMDEVHNIRIQDKEAKINKYEQFHRFLHAVENCKIILLSGTPMKDGPEEIASVMNLILPLDQQLPTSSEFITEYLDEVGHDRYHVKPSMVKKLKDAFRGRVSFMKAMQSNVPKIYEGVHLGMLEFLNVVEDKMSDHQSAAYLKAYEADKNERKGVYSQSRQTSLFVFPDGSYGKEGWDKYVKKKVRYKGIIDLEGKAKKIYSYSLSHELVKEIKGITNDEKLESLAKFSSKYASAIRNILQAHENKQKSFVYGEFVTGSGIILFSLLLQLFGFLNSGKGVPQDKKPRYALISNKTSSPKEIDRIIQKYNDPENMYGEYVSVIIGSSLISEGFSLYNVQVEEILTPWFNYSETSQAIARGLRVGSHKALIDAGANPVVRIYQRVSIPKTGTSIDLAMYETSENKDITTEYIKRIMKVAAFDCALAYERNHVTGTDGQRECEYMDCDYVCDGVPLEMIEEDLHNRYLDYSTYQLYYMKPTLKEITKRIKEIFQDNFRLSLNTLIDYFPEFSSFELVTALKTMIDESTVIKNRYGFPSYLREENNIYFLVDSLSVVGKITEEYYTRNPTLYSGDTFFDIVNKVYYKTLPIVVRDIFNSHTTKEFIDNILKLPVELREDLLEGCILAMKKNKAKNTEQRTKILEYFKYDYGKHDDTWVSWYLQKFEGNLRCLDGEEWDNCAEEYAEVAAEMKNAQLDDLIENNPYGYYGQYNPDTGDFCIRDVREIAQVSKKGGKGHKKGVRCSTSIDRKDSIEMAINVFKIPLPDPSYHEGDADDKLWVDIMKNRYLNNMFKMSDKSKIDRDEMRRILYFGSIMRKPLCEEIRKWMDAQGLVKIDQSCGKHGRKAE